MSEVISSEACGSVIVKGLRLHAYHGVGEQERIVGNEFEVDVTLDFPAAAAMESDDIGRTVSYADVVDIVKNCMEPAASLVEHIAYRIYQSIVGLYPEITHGSVTVYKLHPPISAELDRVGFRYAW